MKFALISSFLAAFSCGSAVPLPVSAAAAPDVVVPIYDGGANTFYLSGKLGELDATDFLLDTGSGYLVINEDSLNRLKAKGQAGYLKEIKGILANGDQLVVSIWRIASLTIAGECVLRDVEAAVFPGQTRQILGLTALKKAAPFVVSFDPPQLTLSHCNSVDS